MVVLNGIRRSVAGMGSWDTICVISDAIRDSQLGIDD